MFIIWQHGKPCVITNHQSSGLNDGIPRDEVHVKYNDMHPFGQELQSVKLMHPNHTLILFKSNVASTFLNLLAHPIWQLNQIVKVDGSLHIVHRLVFGNRASPHCWCAVAGLICWIGIHKYSIKGLYVIWTTSLGGILLTIFLYFMDNFVQIGKSNSSDFGS